VSTRKSSKANNWKNRAVHLQAMDRRERAIQLAATGMTFAQMGEAMGVDKATAFKLWRDALKERTQRFAEVLDDYRALEVEKLDRDEREVCKVMEARHYVVDRGAVVEYPDAETGELKPLLDDMPVLKAIDTRLRIANRRARLLGLDQPARMQLEGGTDNEMRIIVDYAKAPEGLPSGDDVIEGTATEE